jgi:hypothetical protein
VPNPFLTESWFTEMEKLRETEGEPPVPAAVQGLVLNIVVTGGPEGDTEVHMDSGKFERGLADVAPTKITVPYETAKALFIDGNQQAAMQAFMSGQIKVEGDMTKLMAMQSAGAPSAEAQAFQEKIKAITA